MKTSLRSNTFAPCTFKKEPGCVPIPLSVLSSLIGEKAIEAGKFRLDVKTKGLWQIPVSITGVCVSARWIDQSWGRTVSHYTLNGIRTMTKPDALGYEMEGRVSLNGVKVRAFTSSVMFQIQETGKLVSVAVLFV
jgi:hypothetical protein